MNHKYESTPIYPYVLVEIEVLEDSSLIQAPDLRAATASFMAIPKVLKMGRNPDMGTQRPFKVGDYVLCLNGGKDNRNFIGVPETSEDHKLFLIKEEHIIGTVAVEKKLIVTPEK